MSAQSGDETSPPGAPKKSSLSRFLLILGGCAVGGFALLSGAAYLWVKVYGKGFMASTQELAQKGVEFGRGRAADECIDESLRQVQDCSPFNVKCAMSGQVFIQGCLRGANVPEGFCKDVPAMSAPLDSIAYRKDQCERRGQPGKDQCSQIMQGVQTYCEAMRTNDPSKSKAE